MAKFTPGPTVAAVSGSIGGTTYSRNRFGAYMRFRAIPVASGSQAALEAKNRLAVQSIAWQSQSVADRLAWQSWAQSHPVTDTLGNSQVLTGHQAFVALNCRIDKAGDTVIAVPPTAAPPDPLLTLSATWDIGAGDFAITFTATPLAATERLWIQAAVVSSPGVNYVTNLLKLVSVSALAQATGLDLESAIESRFGTLQVGDVVHLRIQVYESTTGLLSGARIVSGTVVST